MPSASDQKLERLANLYALLLETPVPLTREQITDRIAGYPEAGDARRQAFERDKKALRDEGVPVVEEMPPDAPDDNVHGYRIDRDVWLLPDLGLTGDEHLALGLALAAVQVDAEGAGDPLAPFDAAAPDVAAVAHLSTAPGVPVINAAAAAHQPVRFSYHGRAREVDPYGTLFRGGFWYVVGREHEADDIKVFRVDRIDGAVEAGSVDAYEIPDGFRVAHHFPADPTKIGDAPAVVADVLVDADHVARVERWVGTQQVADRRDDGSAVVQVEVVNRAAFRSWLLGLLDHAEVLGPPELRDEVVAWLEQMAARR